MHTHQAHASSNSKVTPHSVTFSFSRLAEFAPADLIRVATGFAGLRFFPGSRWLAALVLSCEGLQGEGSGLSGQDPEKLRQALSSLQELAMAGVERPAAATRTIFEQSLEAIVVNVGNE